MYVCTVSIFRWLASLTAVLTRLRSDTHCECSKSIAYVTHIVDTEYSQ